MSRITDVYVQYRIMPVLQEHQLGVAAVAKQICDSYKVGVDAKTIVSACLLHDMGNIIKFDLSYFPEFLEPEGREYWETIKAEFKEKYGPSEHLATIEIAKQIGVRQKVLDCINSVGFANAGEIVAKREFELKICNYADGRVGPHGVVSIDERLADGRKRYRSRKDRFMTDEKFEELAKEEHILENQVFAHLKIKPTDITDGSVKPIVEQLRTYQI